MKKYSDWFKVDLHIHTDWSKKTKINDYQGNFDIGTLKQKLIENGVKLFSMTDHNIINTDAYIEYYKNYKEGDPLLLIGCEFDIEVSEFDKKETYHSLIIFDKNSIEDVTTISKKVEEIFGGNTNLQDRKITIDNLYDHFSEYEYFFIPHAGNCKSIVDAYRSNIELCQKMVLLMPSAFEKVKESVRQKYNKGFDTLKTLDFQEKDDIPYINFSDNHNCNKYPCTNKNGENHQFYCIKGQPTFESIRFAFIDPKSRIRKESEVEKLKRFDNYIEKISFKEDKLIDKVDLEFSPNLNVIIGGRSSGKSLLFSILGNKINISKSVFSTRYKEVNADTIKIKSKRDVEYKPNIKYNTNEVIYINQGDIVNYFENNSLKDLISESGKDELYKSALEEFKIKKQELSNNIDFLVDSYSKMKIDLENDFTLRKQDIDSILDNNYIFKSIDNIENKNTSFLESENILTQLKENLNRFRTNKNWSFSEDEIKTIEGFTELVLEKERKFNTEKNVYSLQEKFILDVQNIIESKNAQLSDKSREKEAAIKRLTILKSNIFKVLESSSNLLQKSNILEDYKYNLTKEIEISDDVKVILEVEGKEIIKEKVFEGLNIYDTDKRLNLYEVCIKLALNQISVKNYANNFPESFKKKIDNLLTSIFNEFNTPIEYLKYSEGSTSKSNSPGFNSEKYLETILKNGLSKIIFIDQPEDNLGNKFIANKLIDIIRDLKFKKQIFLVTHNPSIVVYGDAENIILCENEDNKIIYKQLTLEEKKGQKEICEVLDGGHYIFDQRSKKYNIKKLIQK